MLQLWTESEERRELFEGTSVGRHCRFPLAVPGRSHERAREDGSRRCNLQNRSR